MARPERRRGPRSYGAGLWNVYLLLCIAMGAAGVINIDFPLFCAFALFVIVPLPKGWHILRTIIALPLGVMLLYYQSWLPSFQSLLDNLGNLQDFSWEYFVELFGETSRFIGWKLPVAVILSILVYSYLKNWIRFSAVTMTAIAVMGAGIYLKPILEQAFLFDHEAYIAHRDAYHSGENQKDADKLKLSPENADKWLHTFYERESQRIADLPASIPEGDIPFDIIFLNICSLSNDDIQAVGLENNPLLKRFDIVFTKFNSATSYSGPATLRLLHGACGQITHTEIYEGRRSECEIMNRLDGLGFNSYLFMDHAGKFDGYLEALHTRSGLKPQLQPQDHLPVQYYAFDGEPIYEDGALFADWIKTAGKDPSQRTATLFNLISLHDGTRTAANQPSDFAPRARKLFKDIGDFMTEIEKSGRKVMLIVVPEHGAAVRGDKVQMARLRDIPSPSITQVPTMVKFFGLKGKRASEIKINAPTTYLAITELIGRALSNNLYGAEDPQRTLTDIATGLPVTEAVSENSNAQVINAEGTTLVRIKNGRWLPYRK